MNIENLLEYQKKDFEIFKLERELYQGKDKKVINEMIKKVNDSKNRSIQLENKASDLTNEFENLKKLYEENIAALNRMAKSNLEKLSDADLASLENTLNSVNANLNVIENKLSYFAKSINVVLADFEGAKKAYNNAREEYTKHKDLYDAEESKIKPQIESITKELLALEKGIDEKLLTRYKAKRQDKRFPIFVPLVSNTCGGCQMELSYATINTAKEKGLVECEHCRRVIYTK